MSKKRVYDLLTKHEKQQLDNIKKAIIKARSEEEVATLEKEGISMMENAIQRELANKQIDGHKEQSATVSA